MRVQTFTSGAGTGEPESGRFTEKFAKCTVGAKQIHHGEKKNLSKTYTEQGRVDDSILGGPVVVVEIDSERRSTRI